ncbi:enoyl-CoA hydratase/isomerase family protein [Mycobacterium sp. shizuoka-1]|uniref:enoyl-CoA hydratase/isomerase family protein n=1 Tax=Mycobacterium sp. shizuoka-1 TaxID=2039281 RepID=UPI000C067A5F|nr:enoyl-CoA hydratase-related protein [Mycobacterium sp. shizuoka-1]GAY18608.1 enoyl-CoA hydratase [Mycobacterium sp. shizuoka-1]
MTVLVADAGSVRTITLNRPEVRNAIDMPLRIALAEAIEAADATPGVRVVVLTGAGGSFCSGGDITTMTRMSEDAALQRINLAQRVIRAIWTTPKPVLAAVEGAAFGAGAALAAACDRVIAAADARFGATFTNVGLAGDMGTYVSLPARIGMARTRQLLMMPTPVSAPDALAQGLVDAVVDPGSALAAAQDDAASLAQRPARALGVIKTMLAMAPSMHPLDVLDREAAEQARLFDSDDFAEAIDAFAAKRSPVFGTTQGAPQ